MKIDMEDKKIFIKTLSLFHSNPDNEELGETYWMPYTFELNEVVDYNEASNGWTTVSFKNGCRWIVGIKYKDFEELIDKTFSIIEIIDSKANFEFKEQK